jgi:hypothetical protein
MDTKYEPSYEDGGQGEQGSEQKCMQNSGRERRYWGEREDQAINSIKNCHVAKADTTRESRYTVHEDSMRHPPGGPKTGPPDLRVELTKVRRDGSCGQGMVRQ